MEVEAIEPAWKQTELLRRIAPKKAVEEYATELKEVLENQTAEREVEAIDWLIEREAEAIKDYLKVVRTYSMLLNAQRAAQAATQGVDTPRPGLNHDAGIERIQLDQEVEQARSAEAALTSEARPRIERLRRLRRIRSFLAEGEEEG
jgi:hypothetical protein